MPSIPPDDPAHVAALGTAGGVGSVLLTWLADHMETIDRILAIATHTVGLGVAVLTFLLLLRRWRRTRDNGNPPAEPPDVDDDLPLH